MAANGLTSKPILSLSEPLSENNLTMVATSEQLISTISKYIQAPSFFAAYLDYRVVIGRYNGEKWEFYPLEEDEEILPKYLRRLRVFNQDEELLLWRSGQTLKGRFRKDGEGDEIEIAEAQQVLFGTKKGKRHNERFTEIREDRGASLILPFTTIQFDKDDKLVSPIHLMTRNYLDYNSIHQATYVDCRFAGFVQERNELL